RCSTEHAALGEWTQQRAIALAARAVVPGGCADHHQVLGGAGAHELRWCSHDHRAVGNLAVGGYQRTGSDDALAPNARAIQHDGTITDQALIADVTTVQHHQVTDGAIAADVERLPRIRVQHAAVLHVAARANLDELIVGAHHAVE